MATVRPEVEASSLRRNRRSSQATRMRLSLIGRMPFFSPPPLHCQAKHTKCARAFLTLTSLRIAICVLALGDFRPGKAFPACRIVWLDCASETDIPTRGMVSKAKQC